MSQEKLFLLYVRTKDADQPAIQRSLMSLVVIHLLDNVSLIVNLILLQVNNKGTNQSAQADQHLYYSLSSKENG